MRDDRGRGFNGKKKTKTKQKKIMRDDRGRGFNGKKKTKTKQKKNA